MKPSSLAHDVMSRICVEIQLGRWKAEPFLQLLEPIALLHERARRQSADAGGLGHRMDNCDVSTNCAVLQPSGKLLLPPYFLCRVQAKEACIAFIWWSKQ